MADVVDSAQQEFWRAPAVLASAAEAIAPPAPKILSQSCASCGSEFMIGAKFCHRCGSRRLELAGSDAVVGIWVRATANAGLWAEEVAAFWQKLSFPAWLRYLHFHEIQRQIGLSTAPFVAFMIGLGCVAGMIGVSLFYKASNLAEFQAIQLWRIEWLLGATAAFVAGILLKRSSDRNR
jgi:hypothetical protein